MSLRRLCWERKSLVIAFVYGRCSVMSCSEETVCIARLFLAGSEPSHAEAIAMVMPVERGPCAQWCQAVRTGVVCRRCAIPELAAQLPCTTAQDWAPRPLDLSTEATVQERGGRPQLCSQLLNIAVEILQPPMQLRLRNGENTAKLGECLQPVVERATADTKELSSLAPTPP